MDLTTQKAETLKTFREIAAMDDLPARARVAFQFLADDSSADWDTFAEAAEGLGYEVEGFEAQDDEDEDCLEITTPAIELSAEALWAHEEKLSLLGAIHGFYADGWGFAAA